MFAIQKRLDPGSLIIIVVTLALFIAALFVKGFGHDLFLEAGVFLVSAKLIIMSFKNSAAAEQLRGELGEIRAFLQRIEKAQPPSGAPPAPSSQR